MINSRFFLGFFLLAFFLFQALQVFSQSETQEGVMSSIHLSPTTIQYSFLTIPPTEDPDDGYLAFLFLGDGNYIYGQMPDSQGVSYMHNYNQPGVFQPFVELTSNYDDKRKPPPGVQLLKPINNGFDTVQTVMAGSLPSAHIPLGVGRSIFVQPTRRLVSGHRVTYAITIEPDNAQDMCEIDADSSFYLGKVFFKYDTSFLIFDSMLNYPNSNLNLAQNINSELIDGATVSTITVNFSNLYPGKQKTVFLQFHTNQEKIYGDQTNYIPRAIVSGNDNRYLCNFSETFFVEGHNKIENSHDPNMKSTNRTELFLDDHGYVNYSIHFQNDGNSDVNSITIIDHLDEQWDIACNDIVELISQNQRLFSISPNQTQIESISMNNTERNLTINLNNLHLKGLNDSKFGIDFNESATKGAICFKIPVSCLRQPLPPCGIIYNSAKIIFECNPPVQTGLAATALKCTDQSSDNLKCNGCKDTLIYLSKNFRDISALKTWLKANYTAFKWYPSLGATSVDPLDFLGIPSYTDHVLVSSTSCARAVVVAPASKSCNLRLTPTITPHYIDNNCSFDATYDINVEIEGFSDASELIWNNCNKQGGSSVSVSNLPPGKYYFGCTDRATGCSQEIWVDLIKQLPLVIDDNPADNFFQPLVSGGAPPYILHWSSGDAEITPGFILYPDEIQVNETVIITDTNGCKACFTPFLN